MAAHPSTRRLSGITKLSPSHLIPSPADVAIVREKSNQMRSREGPFLFKNGKKHHKYDAKLAPYPVSYEQCLLD
jgi:hypothetical protein